jgi:uncharacterized membrane protein
MSKHAPAIEKYLPYILIIGGAIGFVASFILSLDKLTLLQNPSYKPLCSINPLFSCVTVADTHQAAVFGPPNMFIGIGAFAVVVTIGIVMLAGARMQAWFWRLFNLGLLSGMLFVVWLMLQSVYVIGALCLYCMVVWVVMALLFWYTTLYNLKEGNLPVATRFTRISDGMLKYHDVILISWYFLIAIAIVQHFWLYFRTVL